MAIAKASASNNQQSIDVYGNIEIEVEKGKFIRMPIGCPIGEDLRGMNAEQKKLMRALIEKATSAKTEAELVVKPNIRMTLWKRPEEDATEEKWESKL